MRSTLFVRTAWDLVVIDIDLKGEMDGIELAKIIHGERPKLPMLILSMRDEAIDAERALRAGARGYVTKREALKSILDGIRELLKGKVYISPMMDKQMSFAQIEGHRSMRSSRTGNFPAYRAGHDMHEIAERLSVSKKTVETHRANIKEKLAVATSKELVRYATQWVRC